MMNPEYLLFPLIIGQVSHLIADFKTGYVLFDCCILGLLYVMYHHVRLRDIRGYIGKFIYRTNNKQTVVLTSTEKRRSVKVRAIMFYLGQRNNTIYKIREVNEVSWNDDAGQEMEIKSEYMVDQSKEFKITDDIYGTITQNSKEKVRCMAGTEYIDYSVITLYSRTLSLTDIQEWIIKIVKEYKQHLKVASNEQQLYITVSAGKKKDTGDKAKSKHNELQIEAAPWESTITFKNSYFHDMDAVLKKIDFFLKNKQWYKEKGIPYNLGILLYGEPGCGKTRFIKQLMNYTGRHGIDIKLNDQMNFQELYNVIFKEEINDTYIIPQDQRILIFEDIDAMGESVKSRDNKNADNKNADNKNADNKYAGNKNTDNKNTDNKNAGNKNADEFVKVESSASLTELLNTSLKEPFSTTATTTVSKNNTALSEALLYNKLFNETNYNNNLAYLLNMFDGINECSGRIIIMTSNKPEVLDKALIRPGRIDIKLHFQKCTSYDVMRLINLFWNMNINTDMLLPDIHMKYTSAEIYNLFRSTDDFKELAAAFLV